MHSNDRTAILICFLISLVLNAGGLIAVHFAMEHSTPTLTYVSMRPEDDDPNDEKAPDQEKPEFTPGIENGAIATVTWIGYDEYEEQLARQAPVEQAAFTMAEGGGGGGGAQPTQPTADATPSIETRVAESNKSVDETPVPTELAAAAEDDDDSKPASQLESADAMTMPNQHLAQSQEQAEQTNDPVDADQPTGIDSPQKSGARDPTQPDADARLADQADTGRESDGVRSAEVETKLQPQVDSSSDSGQTEADITESDNNARQTTEHDASTADRSADAEEPASKAPSENVKQAQSETANETQSEDEIDQSFEEFIRQLLSENTGDQSQSGEPGTPSLEPRDPAAESSDKESEATSIKKVPEIEWNAGKPLAVEGLEIKPYPLFRHIAVDSHDTLFFVGSWGGRVRQNPIVALSFDRFGKVAAVRIYRQSGYDQFDRKYLKSWLSRWQASGKQLAKLKSDEDVTDPIVFRLIFIPEQEKEKQVAGKGDRQN